jgi:cyclopropane-fatty-acyl-phospholipid synthase
MSDLTPRLETGNLPTAGAFSRLARRLVQGGLAALGEGRLVVEDGGREQAFGPRDAPPGLTARICVEDPSLWRDVLLRGVLGAGEAYVRGAWSADDLVAVVRVFLRNRAALERLDGGAALLSRPLLALARLLAANTRRGSRRNIAAHYDLGNEFFALFLDPTMTYSAGVFEREDATLEEAQTAKYERICRKLGLVRGQRVLEIGCGWGGFAVHAASRHGCHVTAVTISARQHAYALRRVAEAGLSHLVDVVLSDYRDLEGVYDRVVSIEMVEAVGHRWLPRFLGVCADRLARDGRLALQAITLEDRHYDRARRSTDFIKRHVFPGSFIPSVSALTGAAASTDLRLVHLEDIGPHYVPTLAAWRARLLEAADAVRALGFPDAFLRTWDYYFAYCQGGFEERALGDVQMLFAKPADRDRPAVPPLPEPPRAGAGR